MLRLQHIDAALLPSAARWFSAQWEIPARVYAASMQAALTGDAAVPRWYVALDERGAIVAGAGCIENDFHDQVACTPNLCALYVEPAWRGKGVARALMRRIQADAAAHGVARLYLVTEHTAFYERCGWTFVSMARGTDGAALRLYAIDPRHACT